MDENSPLNDLDEFEPYVRLQRRLELLKTYWYVAAAAPLFFIVVMAVRFSTGPSRQLWNALIAISAGWAFAVAAFCIANVISFLTFRCPRCGWRFGGSNRCGSCGLPRHRPSGTMA